MSVASTRPAPLLPPGAYIEDWLEDQEPRMSQREMSARLGISEKHLSQVINGHKPISGNIAAKLELVTGYSIEFWLVNQARYDARRADVVIEEKELSAVKQLLPTPIISRLRSVGIVQSTWREPEKLVRELFAYCRVAATAPLLAVLSGQAQIAFRQSQAYQVQQGASWAWVEVVKARALAAEQVTEFSEDKLLSAVGELRTTTCEEPEHFIPRVTAILGASGVIFVAEPDLTGARVSGASLEVSGTPVIALTDRGKSEDKFWFTLFHEIAHVLSGDHKEGHVDLDLPLADAAEGAEATADNWASDHLLPEDQLSMLSPNPTLTEIFKLATDIGVSPAIIVGRLHHLGTYDHSWGRGLIRRFDIAESKAG